MQTMTALMIGLLVVSLPFAVRSEPSDNIDLCAEVSGLANTIMTARQKNLPMSRLMSIARNAEEDKELYFLMVEDAYESPAYAGEAAQAAEIRDFENKWYLGCHKAQKRRSK